MATQSQSQSSRGGQPAARGAKVVSSGSSGNLDAITLLKGDHRQVEGWFADFAASADLAEKQEIAASICDALWVHTQLEEELFYPAFLQATGDQDLYEEAIEEHAEAKELIADIEAGNEGDDLELESQITELKEMIEAHVREEEQPGGMFDQAAKSELDLDELGAALERRKLQLMDDAETDEGYDQATVT